MQRPNILFVLGILLGGACLATAEPRYRYENITDEEVREIQVAGLQAEQRTMYRRGGTPEYRKWRNGFILRQQALYEARPQCTDERGRRGPRQQRERLERSR